MPTSATGSDPRSYASEMVMSPGGTYHALVGRGGGDPPKQMKDRMMEVQGHLLNEVLVVCPTQSKSSYSGEEVLANFP